MLRVALWFADNWLNLSRIEPHVYADNAAGIPLCKEFEIEDTHCRFAFRNGRYVDAYSRWRA